MIFQRAKEVLDHSLEIAKREGLVDVEATTLINLANLLAASDNPVEAKRTYDLAAEQARAAGMTGHGSTSSPQCGSGRP